MKEEPTYHYSAADIQRYLQGKMSAAEMHAIEKAALDDPFLADALEGYRDVGVDMERDLEVLRAGMNEKLAPKAKVSWLIMAAAAALVISLSFAAWLLYIPGDRPAIAKIDTREKQASRGDQQIVTADSLKIEGVPVAESVAAAPTAKKSNNPVQEPTKEEKTSAGKQADESASAKQQELSGADDSIVGNADSKQEHQYVRCICCN